MHDRVSVQNFFVIGSYENYKKDEIRLILRDSSYGGFEILQQKKTTTLDEEDMEFSDDPDPVDIGTTSTQPEDKWEYMFGVFFIKKNDKIEEIVQVLNNFYVGAGGQTIVKKRKLPTKKADKRPKPRNKEIIIENEAGEDDECEKVEIGEKALIELCLYYEQSNLSLRDCIIDHYVIVFIIT